MKRSAKITSNGRKATSALTSLIFAATIRASVAAGGDEQSLPGENLVATNSGAQIECTTPDGRVVAVPTAAGANKDAVLRDDETLSCPLQEGRTTFVIKLPETSLLDRFTFVNENAGAAGEMKIAFSNCQLPAASAKWVEVDGNVIFHHKRLFNVSMVGVEARYLKLSFDVAKSARIASAGSPSGHALAMQTVSVAQPR